MILCWFKTRTICTTISLGSCLRSFASKIKLNLSHSYKSNGNTKTAKTNKIINYERFLFYRRSSKQISTNPSWFQAKEHFYFLGLRYFLSNSRRFYKKSDLPKKFDSILDCISDNEIFETDHLDITFVDCINGPCKLYTY